MDYKQASDWLLSQPDYQHSGNAAYHPGLDTIKKLLDWLGNPERKVATIHVAGTNGKGSVSHILASVLQENHYKVGLYTSPHFKDFRERIKINGTPVREDFVVSFVERLQPLMKDLKASFFELTTALAFSYFDRERVEIAVIETGLGGRLDATNVLVPLVSVITSIGNDHAAILGDSLPLIAAEKAGIIKDGIPLVLGDVPTETLPVFIDVAKKKKTEIHRAAELKIDSDLTSAYQQKNLNVANVVIELLRARKWQLNKNDVSNGYKNVVINTGFQGRMQIAGTKPEIIYDAAHNGHGMSALMEEIRQRKFDKLHVVFAAASDKALGEIFLCFPTDAIFYLTEFKSPRAQKIQELSKYASERGLEHSLYIDSREAFDKAKATAAKDDLIVVCGSFYLLAELI